MANSSLSLLAVAALAVALFVAAISTLVLPIQPPLITGSGSSGGTPTISVTLYAGEISGSKYGFGLSPNNITSPGPTLRFKTSDVVNITVVNVGEYPHAFAMVNAPRTGATVLFSAEIASPSSPLPPGQTGTVIFKPVTPNDQYYYICPVPGHAELGMYGSCVVAIG